jgi:hypothetical protein
MPHGIPSHAAAPPYGFPALSCAGGGHHDRAREYQERRAEYEAMLRVLHIELSLLLSVFFAPEAHFQ